MARGQHREKIEVFLWLSEAGWRWGGGGHKNRSTGSREPAPQSENEEEHAEGQGQDIFEHNATLGHARQIEFNQRQLLATAVAAEDPGAVARIAGEVGLLDDQVGLLNLAVWASEGLKTLIHGGGG